MSENPNAEIAGATWDSYRKIPATWAVKVPVDVTISTPHGDAEATEGDYLCIDADGGLYPVEAETFEHMYERTGGRR